MSERENRTVIDLFGNEVFLMPRKRGRPPFEWTEENARKVSMMLALGWTNERIAGCIKDPRTGRPISVPTLKRHFRAELKVRDHARDSLELQQLMIAHEKMLTGDMGASRELSRLVARNDQVLADAAIRSGRARDEIEPIGKKEQQRRAAEQAVEAGSGEWGLDLTPGSYGRH